MLVDIQPSTCRASNLLLSSWSLGSDPLLTRICATELCRSHPLTTTSFDDKVRGMDLQQDLEKAAFDSRVDGVVDQFHHRVGRRAVVGEERGGDSRVDPLADGHTLGHSSSKSIPDSPFEFLIASFDRPCGLKGTSSFQPESSPIVPAEIGRLREEIKGLVEQLRLTHALPTSGSQDSSHDSEVDAFAGVDQDFDRNLQPLTEFGLIDRIHINPDALDLQLEFPAADVVAR